jgi:hypothetical protein
MRILFVRVFRLGFRIYCPGLSGSVIMGMTLPIMTIPPNTMGPPDVE